MSEECVLEVKYKAFQLRIPLQALEPSDLEGIAELLEATSKWLTRQLEYMAAAEVKRSLEPLAAKVAAEEKKVE